MGSRVVMSADDVRRAIARIGHEIVERTDEHTIERGWAIFQLARALDYTWAKRSGFSTVVLEERDMIAGLIAEARARLA